MPVYNHFYLISRPTTSSQTSPFHAGPMLRFGPLLPVNIQLPTALATYLSQNGKTVPAPVSGQALIDTGASISAVDASVIQSLGVQPVGVVKVNTPSGSANQNQYPVQFVFPGTNLPSLEGTHAIGSVLKSQGILALIGRDVLSRFVLVYNGPGGFITLAF